MRRFRTRPRFVRAAQWFPGFDLLGVQEKWFIDVGNVPRRNTGRAMTEHGKDLRPGDWLVYDGAEIRRYSAEEFAEQYELAD